MDETSRSMRLLSFLLAFVFCGAIVGETVSLSMTVALAGPQVLSQLYLINGALLLLLPFFFFNIIDRYNRGRIMCVLLLSMIGLLVLYLVVYVISGGSAGALAHKMLLGIYPLSYLSKTILFLTFWTLANDIYSIHTAKKGFPLIAAWGFVGGLCGAFIARLLLEVVEPEMIIGLWIAAYCVAFFFARRIMVVHQSALLKTEDIAEIDGRKRPVQGILQSLHDVLEIKLVPLLAVLYGLVFIAIFSIDFLFWKKCHVWFSTSKEMASFQFAFYEVHGIATILGLWLIMPRLISSMGFLKIFYMLPITLLGGALVLLGTGQLSLGPEIVFGLFIAIQFLRNIVFENAFSPIYQMFFTAIPPDRRGRAKTFLEGVVKPAAIISAGIGVWLLGRNNNGLLLLIAVMAAAMIFIVIRLRVHYMRALVPTATTHVESGEIIAEIGSHEDQKILSLMKEYIGATTSDLRILAVRILANQRSRQAYTILVELLDREADATVRECIARSFANFDWLDPKDLFERLLSDHNPRIRANAICSLGAMKGPWKWRYQDRVKGMLFDSNTRVQTEAASYLWQSGVAVERENVQTLFTCFLQSKNANKHSAGIYLYGLLQPPGWEQILLENCSHASMQVFTKCVEVIMQYAGLETRQQMLGVIEGLSRQHIAVTGRILAEGGSAAVGILVDGLKKARRKRMVFELIHALRLAKDCQHGSAVRFKPDTQTQTIITEWIVHEIEQVYAAAFVYAAAIRRHSIDASLLEDALTEQILRVCVWALDGMVIIDDRAILTWARNDIDLHDTRQRMIAIEIIESASSRRIGNLVIPLLRLEPWEQLARQARIQFKYSDTMAADGYGWFLRSANRWVCLCALYTLCRVRGSAGLVQEQGELLATLAQDTNNHVARAAQSILSQAQAAGETGVETFELLETVFFFKTTMLFRNVPAEKLMGLAEASRIVSHPRDTVISREGEVAEHLYVVKTGSLKIVKIKNNIRVILSIIRKGEAYGEVGLFGHNPRSASAIANEDCQLLVIQRDALKKQLMEMPEIAYNFLEIFSEKLRKSGEEVALLHTTLTHSLKETTTLK